MEGLFKSLLFVHVFAGSIGLLTGTYILFRPKGDKRHQLIGKFFAYGMMISALVSLIMSSIHYNLFLFIVGVFTIYLVGTGLRYLKLKQLNKEQIPKTIDWLLLIGMAIFAILFAIYGACLFGKSNNFGIVLFSFGMISSLMVLSDLKTFKGKIKYKNYWLLLHLQRMTAAYIASLTALLVVNNTYLHNVLAWLLPTIVVSPLIFIWSKKYAL
jgi:uncharacterized membrane protein